MKIVTCPNIPALKEKILGNLVCMEARGKTITKKHRDAAAVKMKEIVQ